MDRKLLLTKLNWFYSLEINQVDLYKTQSRQTKDPHVSRALKKFADIEQGHVENIREMIESLGETPTLIGEVFGELTGTIAGNVTGWTSLEKLLRFDIALEHKAMSDYKALIEQVGDDIYVRELLWNNLIDEELHTKWMEGNL